MSKTYKGQTTNNVVELTLQEEAVGAGFDTPTIAWDDTVNGVITQVQGDIPDNWASTDKVKGPLEIGTSCTSIGSQAFNFCTGLTGALVIPNSVTTISSGAFYGCSNLTGSLVIPDSVTSIDITAFSNCDGLTSLTIGNSVTSIGSYAFYSCGGLTGDLVIPNSVTSIGSGSFYNCTVLNGSLVIPNSVTTIGGNAFGRCNSLTTAYLAPPLANVGSNAFSGSGLTTVYANDAEANGWTLGAGQTVGGKTGVTVIDWTNYPVTP